MYYFLKKLFRITIFVNDTKSFSIHALYHKRVECEMARNLDCYRFVNRDRSTVSALNILVFGDHGVGKTSLVTRFGEDTFYERCFGCDLKVKRVTLDDKKIKLFAWDTPGHRPSRMNLHRTYLSLAHGIMFLFDTTSLESFENFRHWMSLFDLADTRTDNPVVNKMYGSVKNIPHLIVGTKSDLIDKREVSSEMAKDLASQQGLIYLETSAKTGENVEIAYITTASLVLDKFNSLGIKSFPPGVSHYPIDSQRHGSRKCTIC